MKTQRFQVGLLVALVGLAGVLVWRQQAIEDWWRLRGYSAPAAVAQLASEDAMTAEAKHLFYVNRPVVTAGSAFTGHCPAGSEKTVVLGCYVSPDKGIYVYAVTDTRLDGVEQVTAAHEMLHAAYRRLSTAERKKVDAMLMSYYDHGLTDQRIRDTIAAYKKSEPNDVVNEMHSVFGTEVSQLPAPLEQYYRRYFTDRSSVTAYTANYQAEFTGRQAQIAAYDVQLKGLKQQIDANEASLKQQKASIDSESQQLQRERDQGMIAAYNSGVAGYNRSVDTYNALLVSTRNLINQYNDIVAARNAIALEEQQLAGELSGKSLPASE